MSVTSAKSARRTPPRGRHKTERVAQKRRTRRAIVDAAARLIARGESLSVNEVAAAADVSRRTVYLHFPSFDQLLIDATLGLLSQAPVDRAIEKPSRGQDVEARVERMARALQRVTPEQERLGRSLMRLTVAASAVPAERTCRGRRAAVAPGRQSPRRGYRRIEWIEAALAPWRRQLGPARWRRLVGSLAMVVGWEALIVQRDVCGLSASAGEALSAWAAKALVRAAFEERPPRTPSRAHRS